MSTSSSSSSSTISKYTAEKLTFKKLHEWSSAGALHKSELSLVLRKIQRELRTSHSPSKTIHSAIKSLAIFFARKDVRGGIEEKNHRKFQFLLCFPEQVGDDLCFCLIKGEISGRSGAIQVCEYKPILISFHALQRLFERLDAASEEAVLDEIYSCLNWADAWNAGGKKSGAQSWPIPSTNGFFVATLHDDARSASTITWMRSDSLSQKWGVVNDNIIKLNSTYPDLMFDEDFLKEFIGSFPWMMHEHRPGLDFVKLAWDSKDFELESEKDTELIEIEDLKTSLSDLDDHIQTDKNKVNLADKEKKSVSYISGLNYQEGPPPFKNHSPHKGVVVQKQRSGSLIVSLQNSWYGEIPKFSSQKAYALGLCLEILDVGDAVEVEVWRIKYSNEEKAYSISLAQKDLADANWLEVEKRYPLGSKVNAETFAELGPNVAVRLDDRVTGIVPKSQVQWWQKSKGNNSEDLLGLKIEFTVVDYNNSKRNLQLEIENYKKHLAQILTNHFQKGMEVEGTVFRVINSYALIQLDSGFSAMLHSYNCWGKQMPIIGERIVAQILNVDLDATTIEIGFKPPEGMVQCFSAIAPSDKKWALFEKIHHLNEKVIVQILASIPKGFIAALEDGDYGIIPHKEFSWTNDIESTISAYKIGDLLEVKIIDIMSIKKRIIFSQKALKPHPLDDPNIRIAVDESYIGVISNQMDYGYFVHLPFGMDGLLHKVEIPESIKFSKGDELNVCIKSIDLERKRISLSLSLVDSENSKKPQHNEKLAG